MQLYPTASLGQQLAMLGRSLGESVRAGMYEEPQRRFENAKTLELLRMAQAKQMLDEEETRQAMWLRSNLDLRAEKAHEVDMANRANQTRLQKLAEQGVMNRMAAQTQERMMPQSSSMPRFTPVAAQVSPTSIGMPDVNLPGVRQPIIGGPTMAAQETMLETPLHVAAAAQNPLGYLRGDDASERLALQRLAQEGLATRHAERLDLAKSREDRLLEAEEYERLIANQRLDVTQAAELRQLASHYLALGVLDRAERARWTRLAKDATDIASEKLKVTEKVDKPVQAERQEYRRPDGSPSGLYFRALK